MERPESWFAVHLGRGKAATHAGFLRLQRTRDAGNHRVIEQQVSIHGRLDGRAINTDATCRLVLERAHGRMVPLEVEYRDGTTTSRLRFDNGRLIAEGSAAAEHGDALPDDVMPTFGVFALAGGIYDQPEASVTFTSIIEATGELGSHNCKVVAQGKTPNTPFPSAEPLWEVVWFSPEGNRVQAFYFDAEGDLAQADWGGSRARRVRNEAEARPPVKARSARQKKVTG